MNKIKLALGTGLSSVGLFVGTMMAHAQTVPAWSASDTDSIITPVVSAFKDTIIWALKTIWPYAVILAIVFGVGMFFFGKGHRMGR